MVLWGVVSMSRWKIGMCVVNDKTPLAINPNILGAGTLFRGYSLLRQTYDFIMELVRVFLKL